MRLVHAHVADLMIVPIKDGDLVRLLEHLHSPIPKNVGHGFGPTLVARGRSAHAASLPFAVLPAHFRRRGFQDRIGVIADQVVGIALPAWQAQPVRHRTRAGCRRLDAGEIWVTPYTGEIRDGRGALRPATGRPTRERHILPQSRRKTNLRESGYPVSKKHHAAQHQYGTTVHGRPPLRQSMMSATSCAPPLPIFQYRAILRNWPLQMPRPATVASGYRGTAGHDAYP